jgi:hypothetical protein
MAGRLQSEQVADITSESAADFVGMRTPGSKGGPGLRPDDRSIPRFRADPGAAESAPAFATTPK